MALSMHFLFPPQTPQPQPPKLHTSPFPPTTHFITRRPKPHNCSIKKSISDAELASDLSKMNTLFAQREEAMDKSRELLFEELCHYMDSKPEEAKRKWRKLDEEAKRVLVKGFVAEWGVHFHPLSANSVHQLLDEHLRQPSAPRFPALKRIMGFSQDK